MKEEAIFSRPVEIVSLGHDGSTQHIEASQQELSALGQSLGIPEIRSLSADVTLTRLANGMVAVEGEVRADIVQACVVSLVPVEQHIEEPFSLRFVEKGKARHEEKPGSEIRIDPDDDDPPEEYAGATIDLGSVVTEYMVLAVDPYPRAPGAILPENPSAEPDVKPESPFSALQRLKTSPSEKR